MVTTGETSAGPRRSAARQLLSVLAVLVLGALVGGALTGLTVGVVLKDVALFCLGLGGLVAAALLVVVPARLRRRRQAVPVPRVALARIEYRRATHGEFADVPVRFDLTVAPDDAPAYRVYVHEQVNLVDLADYPEGRIVVVTYAESQPGGVELDRRPTEEWARRAADARIDTAPEHTRVKSEGAGWSGCAALLLGVLGGAALALLPYWGELGERFDDTSSSSSGPAVTSTVAPGASGGTTTVTTVTGSASSASALRPGEMRRLADTLVTGMDTELGTRITIEEKAMSAVGSKGPATGGGLPMSLRALPYELLPGLVETARTGLGIDHPETWRIDIAPGGGGPAPVVRVTVSGGGRSAYLLADAVGRITERHPG
ncbi:hypothetical protein OG599_16340 [Streptomyces sp. NBC_01335]|uniref:hypothetical protein n=1 Tax=Streptomyces sp. NBC_01335 TaxID=2903828 RepID=UPI002E0E31B9|nr:hypothetical protein OG599_16340 [Streptomyces sp. NBC_01335]